MPPKGKVKTKAAPAQLADQAQAGSLTPNAKFLAEMEQLIDAIEASPHFGGLKDMKPTGVGEGGSAPAFDLKECHKALETGGEYMRCANLNWLDWKYCTAPGVPVLRASVASYADAQYSTKNGKLETLHIVVALDDVQANPLDKKGALQAVSPQEEVLAPYYALGTAVKNKAIAKSDADKWKLFMSTAVFTFKLLPGKEQKEFETIQIRQKTAHLHTLVAYTPVQWVYNILQMKKDRDGKTTAIELAALFTKHEFKAAKGQEDISVTFVENALYIGTYGIVYPDVTAALIEGAELYSHRSMFDSVSKIKGIITKCRQDATNTKWCFTFMLDRVRAGHQATSYFSSNAALFGTKDSSL